MNAQPHDVASYQPSLNPAAVYARRSLEDTLDDTLETAFAHDDEQDAPALVTHVPVAAPVRREKVRVSGRRTAPAAQPGDTALMAVGAGLVSAMMALLMMLASGYGAA